MGREMTDEKCSPLKVNSESRFASHRFTVRRETAVTSLRGETFLISQFNLEGFLRVSFERKINMTQHNLT